MKIQLSVTRTNLKFDLIVFSLAQVQPLLELGDPETSISLFGESTQLL